MTFEQLYNTYFADVYRFSVWLAHDTTEAEDLTSETFIRAWAKRDRFRTETLKGYLFAIARNIFIKHRIRSNKDEQIQEELVDRSPDPHRATAARMDLDRVTRSLSQMPSPERLALVLRTEHLLPYEEIARILEISTGAARVKIHRARRRLLEQAMNNHGGKRWP